MQVDFHSGHLTYCSNIHPGEDWQQTFQSLQAYTTQVRENMGADRFGIGLRLSNVASLELSADDELAVFQDWLQESHMYVFTINGFPYGGFHGQKVKDKVHQPDWTTPERLAYTKRLFDILVKILPPGMDGGVSTSPISYRYWHVDTMTSNRVKEVAASQIADLIMYLHQIKMETGMVLHLDMEPEPDGVLETSTEFISFFKDYLLHLSAKMIADRLGCNASSAEQMIRTHFQLCYDVCHFAVGFEKSSEVLSQVRSEGINIGRIQISAALSSGAQYENQSKQITAQALAPFDEPTYLHQAVIKHADGHLERFRDLGPALSTWVAGDGQEIRTHFHVPVFTRTYDQLISTQQDIQDVLALWKEKNFTNHLEVETYTWQVLPDNLRSNIVSSICRELQWVIDQLDQ